MHIDLPAALTRRFVPTRVLGAGSMGVVLQATDRELGRSVAIKLLRPGGDPRWQPRFAREAEILAGLRHPNIVRFFDFGVAADVAHLVMEYVDGAPLPSAEFPEGPVGPMLQLAGALDELHRAGIVHRDVKPSNVLWSSEGRTVLVDFGLALDLDRTRFTIPGGVVGTVCYVAPEVLAGAGPTGAADWYAWGVALYRLLEGRDPYTRDEIFSPGFRPRPAELRFEKAASGSPEARIVRACMDPDPGRRPDSRAALEAFLPPPPVSVVAPRVRAGPASAPPPRPPERARPPIPPARHAPQAQGGRPAPRRSLPILGALAAIGGGFAIGFLTRGLGRGPVAPEVLAAPERPPRVAPRPAGTGAAGAEERSNPVDGSVMVLVPGGPFRSTTGDGTVRVDPHQVELPAFLIGKLEVTVEQYARFLATGERRPPLFWERQLQGPGHPVRSIDWDDAVAYCRWAGGRLPTVQEWEKAAVGEEGRPYPWGPEPPGPERANFGHPPDGLMLGTSTLTSEAGRLVAGASPYRVLDMLGNVEEWCAEDRSDGDDESRICRGGSWMTPAPLLDVWRYHRWRRSTRDNTIGMRLAMAAPQE